MRQQHLYHAVIHHTVRLAQCAVERRLSTLRIAPVRIGSVLVLMGIFPRGAQPTNPLRTAVLETNRLLAQRFANTPQLTYLDIGQQFLTPDGSLPATIMSDGVHPTDAGYQHWADALKNTGIHP